MNSKQRRQQRVFEHEVTLVAGEGQGHGERYIDVDLRCDRAKMWLQWRTKRKNYTMSPRLYNKQTFKFRDGGLATLFALKWL